MTFRAIQSSCRALLVGIEELSAALRSDPPELSPRTMLNANNLSRQAIPIVYFPTFPHVSLRSWPRPRQSRQPRCSFVSPPEK
jgi:hypothetical protein